MSSTYNRPSTQLQLVRTNEMSLTYNKKLTQKGGERHSALELDCTKRVSSSSPYFLLSIPLLSLYRTVIKAE